MTRNPERTRALRRLAVLAAAVSTIALPFTGLAVHATEANGWSMIHTLIGVVFLVAAGWHVAVNRRALARYASELNPLDGARTGKVQRETPKDGD